MTEVAYLSSHTISVASARHSPTLPELILEVCDEEHRHYTAAVDVDGHLWVSPHRIAPTTYSDITGERIDADSAAWRAGVVSLIEGSEPWNVCTSEEPCTSTLWAERFVAPADGQVRCGLNLVEFNGPGWQLEIRGVGGSQSDCQVTRQLAAGDSIDLHGHWNISGFVGGEQVSVAADDRGMVYFDIKPPDLGCPCINGS